MPEFNPVASYGAKQNSALLAAAEEHLGNLLADLYVAMPSISGCGFHASFDQHASALMKHGESSHSVGMLDQDAASAAVAAIAPAIGVDMDAFKTLVASTRAALTQVFS